MHEKPKCSTLIAGACAQYIDKLHMNTVDATESKQGTKKLVLETMLEPGLARAPLALDLQVISRVTSNHNVCLSVCLSLAGSWRQHHFDTQNKHQCQANYVSFILKN